MMENKLPRIVMNRFMREFANNHRGIDVAYSNQLIEAVIQDSGDDLLQEEIRHAFMHAIADDLVKCKLKIDNKPIVDTTIFTTDYYIFSNEEMMDVLRMAYEEGHSEGFAAGVSTTRVIYGTP